MSNDYNSPINGAQPSGALTDAPMVSATPIWETRGKKRRGFGSARPVAPAESELAETRTFDSVAPTSAMETSATAGYEADVGSTLSGVPVGRRATTIPVRTKSNYAPAAIAVGVLALAGVGAAGLMASQDNNRVPELTPGAPAAPIATASNDLPAPPPVIERAPARATPAPAPARPARMASAAPRVRPAPSASDVSVNTSARIPSAPQAYTVNPSAAPAPAPAAPPAQAAPTPEPIPATPPVQTQEAPAPDTATPDPAPAEATPPQT